MFVQALAIIAMAAGITPAAEQCFARFELDPAPTVVVIPFGDPRLSMSEWAKAVRYDSGRDEIWIAEDAARRGDLELILDHEASHLKAWRVHGEGIETHGKEWRRICRKYARNKAACRIDH